MAQSQLQILVNAKNNASPTLKNVQNDLAGIDKYAGQASQGLAGLAGAAGASGLLALATAAAQTVYELGQLGAEAMRLETAFSSLAARAGENAATMLAAMQDASRGTIENTDLMLAANKAMLLGVADSTDEMVGLLEVAAARGKAMGLSTAQAFDDIVTGLGRGSALILDNLGITIDLEQVNQDYADALGKVSSALTEAEKKQALVNAVMRESKDLVEANKALGPDQIDQIERGATAWANLWTEIGKNQANMVAQTATEFAFVAEALTHFASEAGRVEAQLEKARHNLEYFQNAAKASGTVSEELARILAAGGAEVAALQAMLLLLTGGLQESSGSTAQLRNEFQMLGPAASTAGDGLTAMELKAANLARRLDALRAQSEATRAALASIAGAAVGRLESAAMAAIGAGAMSASEVARIYGPAEEKLRAQLKVLEQLGYSQDELKFKAEELAAKLGLPFTNATEAAREAERQATAYARSLSGSGGVSDAASAAEAALSDLESRVAGVLRGALDPGVGVDPDKLLESMGIPRADAINENARRLADIAAHGLMDQSWLEEFKREVPDIWNMIRTAQNPQEEAAHLLRDFQDGLLTSPIDRGMAKEIVRRAILGEQNMAALAHEIAAELAAEMGIPMAQALSAAQGTIGGGAGVGGEMVRQFGDSAQTELAGSDTGGAIVETTVAQLRSRYSLLTQAGVDAAKTWGTAFADYAAENLPPALINILATLITPAVQARFAQQGTMTGSVS